MRRKLQPAVQVAPDYPMRINKYLALKNYATRRGADELVMGGKVTLNGKIAVLGDKVKETDTVVVKDSGKKKKYFYYAYNKPVGIITHSPEAHEEDIRAQVGSELTDRGVFPVGRLDKASHGLMILTSDGRITDRLLNPKFDHEKEYEVTTRDRIRDSFPTYMSKGVTIEGYKTRPCIVKKLEDNLFRITLNEGKKHQIRRMVAALYNQVSDIKRTRILSIKLGQLRDGAYRPIEGKELEGFLKDLHLIE